MTGQRRICHPTMWRGCVLPGQQIPLGPTGTRRECRVSQTPMFSSHLSLLSLHFIRLPIHRFARCCVAACAGADSNTYLLIYPFSSFLFISFCCWGIWEWIGRLFSCVLRLSVSCVLLAGSPVHWPAVVGSCTSVNCAACYGRDDLYT
ncbi:hypothetical protein N657DRAFT_179051 [Parathielavia appendiculata]|uniref:Uncharacterized protein n=1 Tax=Parathielavia appendiculata TaxID=2587402 RepID=A0AAN6U6F7_9PEZI|nr:hypothetical protein N657DRAFT_179051 [Parathielavia appendiculata]